MKSKSLLYISYYFPPIKSIAVKRNFYFATGLSSYFEKVHVLTTSNNGLLEDETMPLETVEVTSLTTFDYRTIAAKFRKRKDTHFSEDKKSGRLTRFLIRLNESFPFNLLLGEGGMLYIINGYRRGKKILQPQEEKYIITSYRPFANVFIGYLLKLKYPATKWTVSFHDFPIDRIRRNTVFTSLQKWIWQKMLRKSDHAIVVSDGLGNHIKTLQCDATTILNGVSTRKPDELKNKKFTISYTGSLYRNLSQPQLLFQSIQNLIASNRIPSDDIVIVYAGKDFAYWSKLGEEFALGDNLIDCGLVSNIEAKKIQDHANINLLLTWANTEQSGILTGKFYEYLGSSNPILALINGVMDVELSTIFDETGCGLVISSVDSGAASKTQSFIYSNYLNWKNNTPTKYSLPLDHLSWDARVEQLAHLIIT
jgi:hypothetical protein